jgi:hypothetical protein
MKIYKHRNFHKWAKDEGITDKTLINAINEISKKLYDANLGSGLYKKRVAMKGKGKRGSYRTLVAFKEGEKAFFVYGFSKNEKENIDEREQKIYRYFAQDLLNMDEKTIGKMIIEGKLFRVV